MKTTLNIGLENNVLFRDYAITESIATIIGKLEVIGDVSAFRLIEGEWQGETERTLVVEFSSVRMEWLCLESEIEHLCSVFTQKAISYHSEHTDTVGLIYSARELERTHNWQGFDFDFFLYV